MARNRYRPDWERALIALSASVVFTVIVAALYLARTIFIPIALAIFLTFVLSPVVARLQRVGLGRLPAVALTVLLAIVVVAGIGALVAQQVVKLSDTITQPEHASAFKNKIIEIRNAISGDGSSRLGQLIDEITNILAPRHTQEAPTPVVLKTSASNWFSQFETFVSPATEVLAKGAFAFLLTVFMLFKKEDLRNRMIRLLGHGKVTTTTKAIDDASRRISKYLLMQLMVNSTFGALITIGLFAFGVKLSLLWGAIAFLMRYVPYIGTWVGLIPPTLFSFTLSQGWEQPLAVLALFIVLEVACNNVEPYLYGSSMGLSEVAQLVAAGFWAFLWGPIGIILSGPLTVCLLVLGKHVSRYQYFEILLGDEPVLPPRVAFYQRLAARDQDEASDIALHALRESKPVDVYDQVIVPALCLAKRDQIDGDLSAADLDYVARAVREVGEEVVAEQPTATREGADALARVLLCPAHDEVDQVGIELLARLLDPGRWEIDITPVETLASELLVRIEAFHPAVVVVGSLPPGGVAHTRYLVTRIRSKFPDLKLIVGRWGRGEDFADDQAKSGSGGVDWVDVTLAETCKRLAEWYAVFTATTGNGTSETDRNGKGRPVGTAGAVTHHVG